MELLRITCEPCPVVKIYEIFNKEKLMLAHQHNKSAPIYQESNQQTTNATLKK